LEKINNSFVLALIKSSLPPLTTTDSLIECVFNKLKFQAIYELNSTQINRESPFMFLPAGKFRPLFDEHAGHFRRICQLDSSRSETDDIDDSLPTSLNYVSRRKQNQQQPSSELQGEF
jgi:hypothetical protein